MRNVDVISTVMFGSIPFTALWEVSAYAIADGSPNTLVIAAGAAPQVIAAIGLTLWFLDQRSTATAPQPAQVQRRAVASPQRKAVTR
ncbi:hypothetical protein ACPB67_02715 [Micromonospora taraxaci]|uniref:hypothetical protein n=1 Tax=Micromonospora taraxaci TaxID=1316803 RepID=UPI003C2FFF28